ncbi:MAG: Fe-S cluster assembly protein SufD [Planctomycetaceae bacterium]|nr:Fe-S cluster assembly protein SufD [Planctomycetaceae bacterium]
MPATAAPVRNWSSEAFAEFLAARQESPWQSERRQFAFAAFEELLNSPLDPEEFKRIDLRALRPEKFALASAAQSSPLSTLMQHRAEFGGTVSHVDGHPVQATLQQSLKDRGVIFCGLSQFVQDHPDLAQASIGRAVSANADRFAAWHAAFWTGGTVLYVPRNVEVSEPLYSLIGLATSGAADFSHTLVILEEGSSATLLEETASADPNATGLHIGAVELLLAPRSQLRYVQLQNWNDKVWHLAHQAGRVAADATLQWTVGALGSKLSHIHQDVHLDGKGASAQVNGVTFATDKQVISYYTQQGHHAPNTQSDLLYKDVVRDRARMVWRGMIKVDADAQKTDGYQRNDALLMSDDCRADLIPGLEIEADDVRCTHGATAGRVDEEQLFYCMCRGLNRPEAMHMIVEGFFQRVYDRIPVELVRETLSQAVQQKLGLGG